MPTPSPLCLVADGLGPFNPTFPNGLDISPGDTVSVTLQSPTGVTNWYLQVGLVVGNPPVVIPGTGLDEVTPVPPALSGVSPAGLVLGGPTATVTFPFPNAAGHTLLFSSTVTGIFGAITTTFALFSRTSAGYRVGATGMSREGSNASGWTAIVNPAIRQIGTGGGGSGASFVYQQGGTPSGNIFVHFSDALAAAAASNGAPTFIYIDVTHGAPVIPAGSYNLTGVTLVGIPTPHGGGSVPVMTIQNGATITNMWDEVNNLEIHTVSTGPVVTLANNDAVVLKGTSAFLTSNGTFPFFQGPSGATNVDITLTGNFTLGDGSNPVVNLLANGTATVRVGPECSIQDASFTGTVGGLGSNLIITASSAAGYVSAFPGSPNPQGAHFQLTYSPPGVLIGPQPFSGPGTLTLNGSELDAQVNTASGPVTVITPDGFGGIYQGLAFRVADAGSAATNNITVSSPNYPIEDPYNPGTFVSSITINTNYAVVVWGIVNNTPTWQIISSTIATVPPAPDNGRALRFKKYYLQRTNTSNNNVNFQGDEIWGAATADGIFSTALNDRVVPSIQRAGADIAVLGNIAYTSGVTQAVNLSGAGASIVATTPSAINTFTITGLTGMLPEFVNIAITLSGATGLNNGTFFIIAVLSPSVVIVQAFGGHTVPDPNNGAISWTLSITAAPSLAAFAITTGRLIAAYNLDSSNLPNTLLGYKQVANNSENVNAADAIFVVSDSSAGSYILGPYSFVAAAQVAFTPAGIHNGAWPGARGTLILGDDASSSLQSTTTPSYSTIGVWTDPTNNQIWAGDVLNNQTLGSHVGYGPVPGTTPRAICIDRETETFWVVFEGTRTIHHMSIDLSRVTDTGNSGSAGTIATAVLGVAQYTDPSPTTPFSPGDVGRVVLIGNATVAANNGYFRIVSYTSPTQIGIANAAATSVGETNNGTLTFNEFTGFYTPITDISNFAFPGPATNIDDILFDGAFLWGIDRANSTYYQWSPKGTVVASYVLTNDGGAASMSNDSRIYSDGTYIYIGGLTDESPIVAIHPGNGLPVEYFKNPTAGYGLARGLAFHYGTGDLYVGTFAGVGGIMRMTWDPPGIDFGDLASITQTPGVISTWTGTRLGARVVEYTQYTSANLFTLAQAALDGTRILFVDLDGKAAQFPLTIVAATELSTVALINGQTSYVLNDNYGVVELLFDGGTWIATTRTVTNLAGDVIGSSNNNLVTAIQGLATPTGASAYDKDVLVVEKNILFAGTSSTSYDSLTGIMWVGDWTNGTIQALNTSLPVTVAGTVTGTTTYGLGVRKLSQDNNYVYAVMPENPTNLLVINKLTFAIVGLLTVSGFSRDLVADGAGNLFATGSNNIQKFTAADITAAISGFPTPHTSSGGTVAISGAHAICFDGTNLWVGTSTGSNLIYQVSTAPAILNSLATPGNVRVEGLAFQNGFVWAATNANPYLQVDVSTFPAGGSITSHLPGNVSITTYDVYADPYGNTVLIGDRSQGIITRVDATTGAVASSIPIPGATVVTASVSSNGPNPPTIWVTAGLGPSDVGNNIAGVFLYTGTTGTETEIELFNGANDLYYTPPPAVYGPHNHALRYQTQRSNPFVDPWSRAQGDSSVWSLGTTAFGRNAIDGFLYHGATDFAGNPCCKDIVVLGNVLYLAGNAGEGPSLAAYSMATSRQLGTQGFGGGTLLANTLVGAKTYNGDALFVVSDSHAQIYVTTPNGSGITWSQQTSETASPNWTGARGILILGDDADSLSNNQLMGAGVWTDPVGGYLRVMDFYGNFSPGTFSFPKFTTPTGAICLDKESETFWVVISVTSGHTFTLTIRRYSLSQNANATFPTITDLGRHIPVPGSASGIDDIVHDGVNVWGIDRIGSTIYKFSPVGRLIGSFTTTTDNANYRLSSNSRIYFDGTYIYVSGIGGITTNSQTYVGVFHPALLIPVEYVHAPTNQSGYGPARGIAFQQGTGDVYVGSPSVVWRLFSSVPTIDQGTLDSIAYVAEGNFNTAYPRLGARVFEYTNYSDNVTLNLPVPPDGTRVLFIDVDGRAALDPLTLTATSSSINGLSTYVLNDNRGFVELLFDGGAWRILRSSQTPLARVTWPLLAGPPAATAVGSLTPQIIGTIYLDNYTVAKHLLGYAAQVYFNVIIATTNASDVCNVDLIDVNNVLGGGAGAEVSGTNITSTSLTPEYHSIRITALESLSSAGIFQLRLWINPQAAGQQALCYMAGVDVEYH